MPKPKQALCPFWEGNGNQYLCYVWIYKGNVPGHSRGTECASPNLQFYGPPQAPCKAFRLHNDKLNVEMTSGYR